MGRREPAGDALTDLVLKVFRLNGRLLGVAEQISTGTGLTAARWQVLGAVLGAPRPVVEIARVMGLSRQNVQRLADALVAADLAVFRDNPAHKRAKLLLPTERGRLAIEALRPVQASWANRVGAHLGERDLRTAHRIVDSLLTALSTIEVQAARRPGRPAENRR